MKLGWGIKGKILSLLGIVFVVQLFTSCGNDFEKPSTTQTDPLISASMLKTWMDDGKVNGTGYDRVVILDVTSYGTYTTGHIPGALFVDSNDIAQNRTDGVAVTTTEVLEGLKMDDLIQRYGIDGKTTIVFTGEGKSQGMTNATRAYFTFRYWGFPKSRLKLLDGLNLGWKNSYGLEPGLAPSVDRSTFSVTSNGVLRDDLRVSLAEMIAYADGKIPDAVPVDMRSSPTATNTSYAGARGTSQGVFAPSSPSDYTVFEGRIRGAKAVLGSSLYDPAKFTFMPADQLISIFNASGIDSTKTAYVYCLVGKQSAPGFFVLDAILGWPVALYDGSWSQWGQLSGYKSRKGQLDPGSFWRTDIPSRSDLIVYNYELVSDPVFSGTGMNDLKTGPTYSNTVDSVFEIQIDGNNNPDTFSWSSDGGSTWTSGVLISGTTQTLVSNVTVSFPNLGGHAVGDTWTFKGWAARKPVEQLTADPTVCSATYLVDGTSVASIVNSIIKGTTECTNTPNSVDTDGNRIEEADKAYMGAGGSGSGGGGTSVPTGC